MACRMACEWESLKACKKGYLMGEAVVVKWADLTEKTLAAV